jgi:transaldolase
MDKTSYFHRVHAKTPTRFWVNNPTRKEIELALEAGAVGCTTNPSYTWKILQSKEELAYAFDILDELIKKEQDDNKVALKLQSRLVENIANKFLQMYEETDGEFGLVSIQGDPFDERTEPIFDYARTNCLMSPNIIAKIPATQKGLDAMERLVPEGIKILATEVMAVRQAVDVCEAYNKASSGMKKPPRIIFAHITGIYDQNLQETVKNNNIDVCQDALWQAGISIAKKVYQVTREKYPYIKFMGGGARSLYHFTEMVGADCFVTINWNGTADKLIEENPPVVQRFWQPTPQSVIDELITKIPNYRKGYLIHDIEPEEYESFGPVVLFRTSFESAWGKTLAAIKERRAAIEK